MIEWFFENEVVVQTEGEDAHLVIPVVNDSLHGSEYRCRTTTPYGVLERNITIITTRRLYST